jgi:very-short-patch-repair endonuclease
MHRVVFTHKRQSELQARARQLRSHLTPSEARLWAAINGGQLGVHVRRQHNIGRFIVDFVAVRPRLVVEVDGGYHVTRKSADALGIALSLARVSASSAFRRSWCFAIWRRRFASSA